NPFGQEPNCVRPMRGQPGESHIIVGISRPGGTGVNPLDEGVTVVELMLAFYVISGVGIPVPKVYRHVVAVHGMINVKIVGSFGDIVEVKLRGGIATGAMFDDPEHHARVGGELETGVVIPAIIAIERDRHAG